MSLQVKLNCHGGKKISKLVQKISNCSCVSTSRGDSVTTRSMKLHPVEKLLGPRETEKSNGRQIKSVFDVLKERKTNRTIGQLINITKFGPIEKQCGCNYSLDLLLLRHVQKKMRQIQNLKRNDGMSRTDGSNTTSHEDMQLPAFVHFNNKNMHGARMGDDREHDTAMNPRTTTPTMKRMRRRRLKGRHKGRRRGPKRSKGRL